MYNLLVLRTRLGFAILWTFRNDSHAGPVHGLLN